MKNLDKNLGEVPNFNRNLGREIHHESWALINGTNKMGRPVYTSAEYTHPACAIF